MKNLLKFVMVICLMFVFSNMQAQVKFGPKVGVNLSTMTMSYSGVSIDPKTLIGFHAGVISEIPIIGNLALQPGILYSVKGTKIDFLGVEGSISPGYIEIPVNVAYSLGSDAIKFSLFAGPYVAYGINGKTKSGGVSEDIVFGTGEDDDMNPLDYGVNFGAGVNISGLFVSAQYGLGLANLSTGTTGDEEIKNTVIGISLAYLFGGK
jgi:hypothetical protein